MAAKMLTFSEIAEVTGLERSTLTGYKSRGQMPPPDKQYGRTPLWRESTIVKWRKTMAARKQPADA